MGNGCAGECGVKTERGARPVIMWRSGGGSMQRGGEVQVALALGACRGVWAWACACLHGDSDGRRPVFHTRDNEVSPCGRCGG